MALNQKNPGDPMYAGALNENGALEVRATQIGARTTLDQMTTVVGQQKTAYHRQHAVHCDANEQVDIPIRFDNHAGL